MSKTKLKVLFKNMQRDDKKDLLKFEHADSSDNEENEGQLELFLLRGSLVNLEIGGCRVGPVTAEFKKVSGNGEKLIYEFILKGDSEEKAPELYKFAGKKVILLVEPSQSSLIDDDQDFDNHEGLEYTVDLGGNVDVVKNEDEDEAEYEVEKKEQSNVADLEAERMKRAAGDDDDLPF